MKTDTEPHEELLGQMIKRSRVDMKGKRERWGNVEREFLSFGS